MKPTSATAYILLLDDEEELRLTIQDYLEAAGHHVVAVNSAMRAEEAMANGQFDVAILDVLLPDGNGLELLKKFKNIAPNMGVILITGYAEIDTATEALRLGADDFFSKPCDIEDILTAVTTTITKPTKLNQPAQNLSQQKQQQQIQQTLVGESKTIQRLQNSLLYFAQSGTHIFISGDSGTGKTKVAAALHALIDPSVDVVMSLNCQDLNLDYDFSYISNQTLILENIDYLEPQHQASILKLTQQQHVRMITTSTSTRLQLNQALLSLLQTTSIHLPPLNARDHDVVLLAEHFLHELDVENRSPISISEQAKAILLQHHWQGNVSALQNCIQQAALCQQTGTIEAEDLPYALQSSIQDFVKVQQINLGAYESFNLKDALATIEKNTLYAALERFNWNQFHTAKFLCMNRTTLIEKIKKRGLKKPSKGL